MHQINHKAVDLTKAPGPSVRNEASAPLRSPVTGDAAPIAGNQAIQRLQRSKFNGLDFGSGMSLPSGLNVSHPDAKTEREASTIGDRLEQSSIGLQRLASPNPSVGSILGSTGRPLPESIKLDHDQSLRAGLSQVRVHDDAVANAFTHNLGAKAATWGSHIYFGRNRFDPQTQGGRRLLAHELTHTLQPESVAVVQRAPEDDAVLKQIDAQLGSRVISDEYRAELEGRRAALADRPKFELLALAKEAERRNEASASGTSTAEMGPSSVTAPLTALIPEPEPLSGRSLFSQLLASPGEEQAQQLSVGYVLDQYLEGKLDWPVKVDLVETGGGVWFNFSVFGKDLVASEKLDLPLSALDAVSAEWLKTVTDRATQIVEVATLCNAFPEIVSKIGTTPEDMIKNPEDYARNEADSILMLVGRYNTRLESLSKSLLPANDWLASFIQKRREEINPVIERLNLAHDAAYKFHSENQPATYAGETYDRVIRESSSSVERVGWKAWRFLGDLFTLGGQSTQAENVGMYRRGEISRTAYRKNWVLAIGGVAVKAAITALTAGRGTGLAMRFLALEAGTTAAVVATGAIEGVTTGFAQAFSSDLYAKSVATVSSDPGVVAFHERMIGGPSSWFESAAWGGIGGAGLSFASTFLPKTPFDPKSITREPVSEPSASAVDAAMTDVRMLDADLETGEITLAVRHPLTGELFSAKGNVNTGNAVVRNMTTGEVVGYIREGEYGPPAPGGELPGKVAPPESGVAPAAETGLVGPMDDVLAPAPDVMALPPAPADTFGPPAPPRQTGAFAPGTAPRSAAAVTRFLRDFGLEESEIISFGGADASRLGPRTAARVALLAEHFTAPDIKALAQFLDRYDLVINDATARMLMREVEPGTLAENLKALEDSAAYAQQTGLIFDMEGALNLTEVTRSTSRAGGLPGLQVEPPWRIAERELGPVLERDYGPGWQVSPRVQAPGAASGETLGSTVPEYYHPGLKRAFEVKRFDLSEMGIGAAGEDIGGLSQATVDALARARRQLAGRQWALPSGTEQNIVFNVTDQGVTNVAAVGGRLRTIMESAFIRYDRVFVQNGNALTEIQPTP